MQLTKAYTSGDSSKQEDAKDVVKGAQTDGATQELNGSGLQEPEFDVEVKLSDMQADPNNPLFSSQSFEDLGLYVDHVRNVLGNGDAEVLQGQKRFLMEFMQ